MVHAPVHFIIVLFADEVQEVGEPGVRAFGQIQSVGNCDLVILSCRLGHVDPGCRCCLSDGCARLAYATAGKRRPQSGGRSQELPPSQLSASAVGLILSNARRVGLRTRVPFVAVHRVLL